MNQILVSQKLYVTPDMKKKKKAFKFEFFLSVFLLCVLSSYAIYAEYDRNNMGGRTAPNKNCAVYAQHARFL